MVFQDSFLEAAQRKAAEKRATPEYQEALPRKQFEQILKILDQNDFNISRNAVKNIGEQVVIKKNEKQYQIFILNNECISDQSIIRICEVNEELEKAKSYLSALQDSYRARDLRLRIMGCRSHGLDEALIKSKEKQKKAINEVEQKVSEMHDELTELSAVLERRPLQDIMPEFGAWVGDVAPELVEFIGAHLEMSEGRKPSKRVQKVTFSK